MPIIENLFGAIADISLIEAEAKRYKEAFLENQALYATLQSQFKSQGEAYQAQKDAIKRAENVSQKADSLLTKLLKTVKSKEKAEIKKTLGLVQQIPKILYPQ